MTNDPYTDDEYDDSYKEVHGDEPTKDQYTDETTDDALFPSGVSDRFSPSGWGIWPTGGTTADAHTEATAEDVDTAPAGDAESDDESWWGEGLAGTLLLVGAVLFFIPEPATTGIGILLLGAGVAVWIADWLM